MIAIELDENLINKVLTIGHYQNAQKAIDTILADYIKVNQQKTNAFDKLRYEVDMKDEDIDNLFSRDNDRGRSVDL